MQQAIGLMGAVVNGYPAFEVVVADFGELDTELFDSGVFADVRKDLHRDRFLPNAHGRELR
jgi:hypothetical protein